MQSRTDAAKQPPVRLYLDFDGTLTGQGGQGTFNFLANKNWLMFLRENSHSPSEEIAKEMLNKIRELNADDSKNPGLNLVAGAANFLKTMLAQGAEIIIVSRNYKAFIQAVLEHGGLNDNEIKQIAIHDKIKVDNIDNTPFGKHDVVQAIESQKQDNVPYVICDDDETDRIEMGKGVLDAAKAKEDVQAKNIVMPDYSTGQFDWNAISKTTQEIIIKQQLIQLGRNPNDAQKITTKEAIQTLQSIVDFEADTERVKRMQKLIGLRSTVVNEKKQAALNKLQNAYEAYEKTRQSTSSTFAEVETAFNNVQESLVNVKKVAQTEKDKLFLSSIRHSRVLEETEKLLPNEDKQSSFPTTRKK